MISKSDVGKGLNMEEFSFMSKRLPEKETGERSYLMCQQSLAVLYVLIFTALAQVNDQPAQHLLWLPSGMFVCLLIFKMFSLLSLSYYYYYTPASCITNIP